MSNTSTKSKYHYCSKTTGEIVTNLREVIKVSLRDLRHYKVIHRWKYSKGGF